MPIPYRPPVLDEQGWSEHALEVKRCRGSACYHAVVEHFGRRSPRSLDELVDQRAPSVSKFGEPSGTGKFQKWKTQGKAPSDTTISAIHARTGGKLDLRRWRDSPLFHLLERHPPTIAWLQHVRENMPRPVRKVIFEDGRATGERFIHLRPGRKDYLALRALGTLDAFTTLLCFAREGEILGHDPSQFLPSACAFDMLPKVLLAQPPLRAEWHRLFDCIERIYFRFSYGEGMYFKFERVVVEDALRGLENDPLHTWPLLAGIDA